MCLIGLQVLHDHGALVEAEITCKGHREVGEDLGLSSGRRDNKLIVETVGEANLDQRRIVRCRWHTTLRRDDLRYAGCMGRA